MLGFYLNPNGRVSRRDYLLKFLLPYVGVVFALAIAFGISISANGGSPDEALSHVSPLVWLFGGPIILLLGWASIAVGFKRLHDVGKSGWWQFLPTALSLPGSIISEAGAIPGAIGLLALGALSLLSLAVSLWLLYVMVFKPGNVGDNAFGPNPLES